MQNIHATRAFEFSVSLAGLALLSPVFAIIAILIRMEGPGPIFFRQTRIGRNGKPFTILKFRTMFAGAEHRGRAITVGADPRITPSGLWLRRWKLDELPQLINVLRGDMGLVGPRPEVPRYVDIYSEEQRRVLALRPGITDVASIRYRNESDLLMGKPDPEAFYIREILPHKIHMNLSYASRASLWRDIKVILATFRLLNPEGL